MLKTISGRISLLFLAATLIPVFFFGAFLAGERYRYLEQELLDKRQAEARHLANVTSSYLDKLSVELEMVATLFSRQGMADAEKFLLFKTLQTHHPVFSELGSLDKNGRQFRVQRGIDTPPDPSLFYDYETLERVESQQDIVASIINTGGELPQLQIACPVFFLNRQFINGAILARIDLDELDRQIHDHAANVNVEATTFLPGGKKISRTTLTLPSSFKLSHFDDVLPDGKAFIIDKRIIAMVPIRFQNLEFIMTVGSNLDGLEKPWRRSLLNFITLFLVILSAILVTGRFFVERLFTGPLKTLTRVAGKIRDGNLDQQVELDGQNEFSELATAFNSMTTALLQSRNSLLEESRQRKDAETSSREAMVAAQQANEAKSIFLANMSHEIRTPINGIMGLTSILLDGSNKDKQSYRLKLIKRSTKRLLSIINVILNFSKIEAGESSLELTCFDPREIIEDALELIQIEIEGKDIQLSSHVDDDIPENLMADAGKIHQVVLNLLSNGIKNTDTGKVKVSLSVASGTRTTMTLCFRISDTGHGVSEKLSKTIFEPFSQGVTKNGNGNGGAGLGLAICSKLARLLGGEIWFENNEDGGSSFYFSCRCEKICKKESEGAENSGETADGAKLAGMTVFIAEDEFINQHMLLSYLKEFGAETVISENGSDLLAELEKKRPDVILMDIQMPVMDGLEATEKIRQLEKEQGLRRIPIIALTAHATVEFERKCFSSGVDHYLTKPLDLSLLPDILLKQTGKTGDPASQAG
ncbi:MAG: ATP-binding protein [Thermodesulfobacteriota bacterium]